MAVCGSWRCRIDTVLEAITLSPEEPCVPIEFSDSAIRAAAFNHLEQLSTHFDRTIPRTELIRGFDFQGVRIPLMHPAGRGIWKPQIIRGAPLSITTTVNSPYGDRFDEASQMIEYHYQGTNPESSDNRSIRDAWLHQTPVIYFHGILAGQYLPFWPCFIKQDVPAQLMCLVQVDDPTSLVFGGPVQSDRAIDSSAEIRRGYVTRAVRTRIHQEQFRRRVLDAYRTQCAFCRLRHAELLTAAHITPDSESQGEPKVSNGIALCSLHHAAFDRFFVAVRPDLVIEVRPDILREIDGPTLVHAVQSLHGLQMQVPTRTLDRPDEQRLVRRYAEYQSFLQTLGSM
jgi:putative restriction endonuclease